MIISQSVNVYNRKHAGLLLAEKVKRFIDSDTVVIGVSHGGAVVGFHLASALNLGFHMVPCKEIDHPANARKTIGSVALNEVIIHEDYHDIPREYIRRQILVTQNALKAEQAFYNPDRHPVSLKDKTVIVVADVVTSADGVLASLKSIKKQNAKKMVVAIPAATQEVISLLSQEADALVLLAIQQNGQLEQFYEEYAIIRDEEVKELITKAMNGFKNA